MIPMLGYKAYSLKEASALADEVANTILNGTNAADFAILPPQLGTSIEETDAAYVTYISPAAMRSALERLVDEHGESILEREKLKAADPELFYNLWWYCARFSLPLPLPIPPNEDIPDNENDRSHYVAVIAWYVPDIVVTISKKYCMVVLTVNFRYLLLHSKGITAWRYEAAMVVLASFLNC
jgi:hypothetical protein